MVSWWEYMWEEEAIDDTGNKRGNGGSRSYFTATHSQEN
jgi:hypothetical protein